MKIEVQIDELLRERQRSFYWLSKESGISHTTLWRLKKGRSHGINFATLEKICAVLECTPGDVLVPDVVSSARKNHASENRKI